MAVYRLVSADFALLKACPIPDSRVLRHYPDSTSVDIEIASDQQEHFYAWCEEKRLDYSVPGFSRHEIGLLAMDMDSTLITIECIDEIADFIGKKDEVAAITEASMQGKLDFSASLLQRVALLEGVPESTLEAVYSQRLTLSPGAEVMISALQAHGVYTLLVSGGFTFFTERLKEQLGLDEAHANVLEVFQGRLTGRIIGSILDGQAKAAHVRRVKQEKLSSAGAQKVVAIGDGSNDRWMFAEADAGVAYHAKPVLEQVATHRIRYNGLETILAFFESMNG